MTDADMRAGWPTFLPDVSALTIVLYQCVTVLTTVCDKRWVHGLKKERLDNGLSSYDV